MDDPLQSDLASNAELAKYDQDPAFHEFVDRAFDQIASEAPLEDLIIFAFGGLHEAIEAFEADKQARREAEET